ncbi:MAG TPA: protein kinase, partial [Ktedonobacter sp.]|nr:protein kinase [Ktedonobacter sp.]
MANNYSNGPGRYSSMNNSVSNPNNSANPISGSENQSGQSGSGGTEPEFSLPSQFASPVPVRQTPAANNVQDNFGQDRRRLSPGTELSDKRYVIERLAGVGGMGAVYLATDRRFNKPCAVKEMLDSSRTESERTQAIEWFSREASLLIELNHQCIPHVRDFFTDNGKHYLVMDFIKGRTMSEAAEQDTVVVGPNGIHGVAESRARHWGQQLCNVLSYLHSQTPPIIFRDLKPSNIMVTENDTIKLIDFGIARPFQNQAQATVIMTHGYAPQEQVLGSPEPRSDIYALGATLFRVLTHHDPSNNKPNVFTFPALRQLRPDISLAYEQVVM